MTLLLIILVLLLLFGGGGFYSYRGGYLGSGPIGPGVVGLLFILLLVWLLFGSPYAMAADNTVVHVGSFYQEYIKPTVVAVIGAVAVAALGVGWTWAQAHWSILRTQEAIQIESKARDIVQTAATDAAGRILAKYDGPVANLTVDVRDPAIAAEVNSVALKVGPELKQLGVITPAQVEKTLSDLIAGKVGILQSGSPAAVSSPAQEVKSVPSVKSAVV